MWYFKAPPTHFPCLDAVKMTSCKLPASVHIRQIECFERTSVGRTMRGHCWVASVSFPFFNMA